MLERPDWSIERRPAMGNDIVDDNRMPLLTLFGALAFLRRFGGLIVGIVVGGVVAALIYLMGATPVYRARAQLLIESKVPHSFIEQISEAMVALDTPQIESQLALLRSEQIAERVVRKHNLIDDPELQGKIPSWSLARGRVEAPSAAPVTTPATLAQASPAIDGHDANADGEKLRAAIEGLQSRMEARRVGLSYAIDIVYASADPTKAARLANAIADAYVEDRLRTRAHSARQGSEWLEERIADIRRQMNAAALDVQQFRARRDYRILGRPDRGSTDGEGRPGDVRSAEASGAATAPGKEAQTLEELEARAHTYRKIYESYLQGYAESVQRQSFPVTNDRVITRATRPVGKSHPRGLLTLVSAGILSAVAAFGLALVLYSLNDLLRLLRQGAPGYAVPEHADPVEPEDIAEDTLSKAALAG